MAHFSLAAMLAVLATMTLTVLVPGANGARLRTSKQSPWRASYDASRIQSMYDNAEDSVNPWERSSRGSGIWRTSFSAGEGEEAKLSQSSAAFEKYVHDFEGSSDVLANKVSPTRALEDKRHKLEMEGNFAAAEELNPFESLDAAAPSSSIDTPVADRWAPESESPFRRMEKNRQRAERAARTRSWRKEEKLENDELTLDTGVFAFENMVKSGGAWSSPVKKEADFASRPPLRRSRKEEAAEEKNSWESMIPPQTSIDTLAEDALFVADRWAADSPSRRHDKASRDRDRLARIKAETQEENAEFALDTGVYAFDNMVKKEVSVPEPSKKRDTRESWERWD